MRILQTVLCTYTAGVLGSNEGEAGVLLTQCLLVGIHTNDERRGLDLGGEAQVLL